MPPTANRSVEMQLPDEWQRADRHVLDTAMKQARSAIDLDSGSSDHALPGLVAYFDHQRPYAGELFTTLGTPGHDHDDITPADLLAVTTLSMRLDPRQVRQLLDPESRKRKQLINALGRIPADARLEDLARGVDMRSTLSAATDFYRAARTTPTPRSNRWVFASKLAARKRPLLLPVRDNVVCKFLANQRTLRKNSVGSHDVDVQVFAHLINDAAVRTRLESLKSHLLEVHANVADVSLLRILDVALWNAGIRNGYKE